MSDDDLAACRASGYGRGSKIGGYVASLNRCRIFGEAANACRQARHLLGSQGCHGIWDLDWLGWYELLGVPVPGGSS